MGSLTLPLASQVRVSLCPGKEKKEKAAKCVLSVLAWRYFIVANALALYAW